MVDQSESLWSSTSLPVVMSVKVPVILLANARLHNSNLSAILQTDAGICIVQYTT